MRKEPTFNQCVPMDALEALDRINTSVVASETLDEMLVAVLDDILDIFQCDRAWLMLPYKDNDEFFQFSQERTRPDFPGALALSGKVLLNDQGLRFIRVCTAIETPTRMDPATMPDIMAENLTVEKYGVKAQMLMPLRPLNGEAWVLGIHHCREAVLYEQAEALFDAIGKRIGAGLTTHLTLQKLRDSENRYRALVDNATDAILIFDADSNIYIEANAAADSLFGCAPGQLAGNYGLADLSPEFQPDGRRTADICRDVVQRTLAGEFPRFESMRQRIDGKQVPCEVTLAKFPDPERRLLRVSIQDISDRKAAEEERTILQAQLVQVQKLESVGQMSGGVAHDFNNLLGVILGNLELLQDESTGASQDELIEAAIAATMRGADLTQKMLSFARRAHLDPAVLDLRDIVRDMDGWMRRTLPAVIDVQLSLADDLWSIEADLASTESALLNLVINARDAMPDGGRLSIEVKNVVVEATTDQSRGDDDSDAPAPGAYVLVQVRDTGTGIPENALKKVFEPFYTTKPPGQSSGLGLSMVYGFMRQSGGTATIESTPGESTTLSLYFKALRDPAPIGMDALKTADMVAEAAHRVLFAEDQSAVADILVRILTKQGYDVEYSSTGDAAYEKFQTEGPFDLLITDIVMPGKLQGPDLARALRELNPELPIVFMSGYAREASMHGNGLHEGDIRLMKPVTRSTLLSAVQEALRPPG